MSRKLMTFALAVLPFLQSCAVQMASQQWVTNQLSSLPAMMRVNRDYTTFVKEDGTIYYYITNSIWSTNRDSFVDGARLYFYCDEYQTNWYWYVKGGTSSSYRSFEAPLDADVLKFRYNAATTNTFIRGGTLMYAEEVAGMIRNSKNALKGKMYDFESLGGLYEAVSNIVTELGGSITNYPSSF